MQPAPGRRIQRVQHVVGGVDADLVEQGERTYRVAAAEAHGCVDVITTGVSGLVHGHGVIEVAEEQPIGDVAGLGSHDRRLPPHVLQQFLHRLHGITVGEVRSHEFDVGALPIVGHRQGQYTVGLPSAQGEVGHRQRGGRRHQDRTLISKASDLAEDPVLEVAILRQTLDDYRGRHDVLQRLTDLHAGTLRRGLRLCRVLLDTDDRPPRIPRQTRDLRSDRTHPDDCHRFLSHAPKSGKAGLRDNRWVWHARPLDDPDIEDVVAMVNECERADSGEVMLEAADLVSDLASLDRQRDAVVVVQRGRIVGWGMVWQTRKRWADVHPEARGQGIGEWLLKWSQWRAQALHADRIGQTIDDARTDVAAWLQEHGYTPRYSAWILSAPARSGEYTAAPATSPEIPAVLDLFETTFAEHADRAPVSREQWRAATVERPGFADDDLLVLRADGRPVAAAFLIDSDEVWIDKTRGGPRLPGTRIRPRTIDGRPESRRPPGTFEGATVHGLERRSTRGLPAPRDDRRALLHALCGGSVGRVRSQVVAAARVPEL